MVRALYINFYMCDFVAPIAIMIYYFGPLTPDVVCGSLTCAEECSVAILNSNSGFGRRERKRKEKIKHRTSGVKRLLLRLHACFLINSLFSPQTRPKHPFPSSFLVAGGGSNFRALQYTVLFVERLLRIGTSLNC